MRRSTVFTTMAIFAVFCFAAAPSESSARVSSSSNAVIAPIQSASTWTLSNPTDGGLPATVYLSSSTTFKIALSGPRNGPSGMPGIPVAGVIVSGGGSLIGRDCRAALPDRTRVDAECALTSSSTEKIEKSGYYPTEFVFNSTTTPGTVELLFVLQGSPGGNRDIILRLTVNVVPRDNVSVWCPPESDEGKAFQCSIIGYGAPCRLGPGTTCAGAHMNNCSYVDVSAQGEGSGGSSCAIEVIRGTASDSTSAAINMTNQAPYWASALSDVTIGAFETFNGVVAVAKDDDLPSGAGQPGYITCSLGSSSCAFPVTVGGSGSGAASCGITFTAGRFDPSCSIDLAVSDGFDPSATVSASIDIEVTPFAGVWYVSTSATGKATGLNWDDAFNHPQDAMSVAIAGDQVWVAAGEYPSLSGGTGPVLALVDGVSIHGGFVGNETSLAQRLDPAVNPTVLDGEGMSYHVVVGASDAWLDGLTITGGAAKASSGQDRYGAGILVASKANFLVSNCIVTGNTAVGEGGGMYLNDSEVEVTDSTFIYNRADYRGGGISTDTNSIIEITASEISYNTSGYHGGGVNVRYSTLNIADSTVRNNDTVIGGGGANEIASTTTITGSAFIENTSGHIGGGIHRYATTASISNSLFHRNIQYEFYAPRGSGGAVTDSSSAATYDNSTFTENYGVGWAGGVNVFQSSDLIMNCVFIGNTSLLGGGAISSGNGTTELTYYTVVNSLIVNNNSSYGGAIFSWQTSPTVIGSTFAGNTSTLGGGVLWIDGTGHGTVRNSVFWYNTKPKGADVYVKWGSKTVTYSDVGGGNVSGTGNMKVDPQFAPGPFGNYYLSQTAAGQATNSPCVDAGDPADALYPGTTASNEAPDSVRIDMGYHYPIQ